VDLQRHLHGKREIVKSVGTADPQEAKLLAAQWQHRLLSLFSRLRKDGPLMDTTEIDAMVARYMTAQLDAAEAALVFPGQTEDDLEGTTFSLQDQLESTEQDLKWNRFGPIRGDALALLGVTALDEDSEAFRILCRRLLEAKHDALWAELNARRGEPLRRPQLTHVATYAPPAAAKPATPMLSAAFASFNDTEGTRRAWRPKTRMDHLQVQRVLLDFLGDKPVGEVTKDDLRNFYAMIRQAPVTRSPQYKGMTIPQLVEATRGRDIPRLAAKSINGRYLSVLKSFFNHAERADWCVKSPAVVLEPMKVVPTGSKDKGYGPEQLQTIFGGLRAAAEKSDRLGYYYLALLALHSGARLDEVAGLRCVDVRETDGHWCMHFDTEGGRALKNSASARIVPIHSRVIELGFLDYLRAQTGERLVGNLYADNAGKFGQPVTQFFAAHLTKVGVKKSRNQNFHSLRHTWRTAMDRAGVSEAHMDELGGWSARGSQGRKTYTADNRIPLKAELIERLRFI
jgi:integrase